MPATTEPDYYHELGVKPTATADQIKAAYRTAAKRAHPDAGGSHAAMERVNAAYAVLSDSLARREYDRAEASARAPIRNPARDAPAARAEHPAYHPGADPATARAEAERRYRAGLRAARLSTWPWLRTSGILAILLSIATPFLVNFTASGTTKTLLILLAFAPVYGFAIGITFLIRPRLRIALSLIGRRGRHIPHAERLGLIALALAAIPLAIIWAVLFNFGLLR